MPLSAILKTFDMSITTCSSRSRRSCLAVAAALFLFVGCKTSELGASAPPPGSEATEAQAPAAEATSFPEGILHFGGFEPGNPRQCAYLNRPRPELGAEAEAWLVERQIMVGGFPINLYGEGTPAWAEGGPVYVYCEEEV